MFQKHSSARLRVVTVALSAALLAGGFFSGYWLVGCGLALVALCSYAWFASLAAKSSSGAEPKQEAAPRSAEEGEPLAAPEADGLVDEMLGGERYSLLLRPQIASNLDDEQMERAQSSLDDAMSIVPAGDVLVTEAYFEDARENVRETATQCVEVDAVHLDRHPVTNRQFKRFVDDGGYEQVAMWDAAIWPAVLEFVDLSGYPGPRFWRNGGFPEEMADHPVVGISWFEAGAYARWVGKRLPTSPEWVKAGAWPVSTEGEPPHQRKFPWGDSMDRSLANLWGIGPDATCPVDEFRDGSSVGGVMQLIGNVWEWTHSSYAPADPLLELPSPMKVLHGGAFDTYFDSQANCQFRTADSPLSRKHNIGFRCALGVCDIVSAYSGIEPEYEQDELVACGAEEEEL